MNMNQKICIVPTPHGVGGMVSFYERFKKELSRRNVEIATSVKDTPYKAILVIGGSKDLRTLVDAKRKGVRIVQRLDGMNWIHRKKWVGLKHFIKAEYGNFLLSYIRRKIATAVVYQSEFARQWWERIYGKLDIFQRVIYNGIDLTQYSPEGEKWEIGNDAIRLLMVEGSLGGGYEFGLQYGVALAEGIQAFQTKPVELLIVGKVSDRIKKEWGSNAKINIQFTGILNQTEVPKVLRSAPLFYASDIHPACPNTVLEAMGCGVPVVAFDTGALPEIIRNGAGEVVPYGGNAWKLEPPQISHILDAAKVVLSNLRGYKEKARQHCEANFGIEKMVNDYLEVILHG